jgi:uncharacterized surface protein with fasciclin (FAS1) repeats
VTEKKNFSAFTGAAAALLKPPNALCTTVLPATHQYKAAEPENKGYITFAADDVVCKKNHLISMSTILQIANTDKSLSILMKGFKAAHLEETLSGLGPFTILAPVNLAFGKLLAPDTFDELVKQADENSKLANILSFHVITGKKLLKDFRHGQKLTTVNGKELLVTLKNGDIHINGAKILARDRQGSNGVVHSVDMVNLPAEETNL